jgi:3-oxoacyl-[acyl-carrier protein] reductase
MSLNFFAHFEQLFGPYPSRVPGNAAAGAHATDAGAVKAAVEKAVATFKGLDILENNAGVGTPKPFEESILEEINRVLDINL